MQRTTITGARKTMTAAEVRAALDDIPGEAAITVRVTLRGGIKSITLTTGTPKTGKDTRDA